ncbi:MAG: NAD-dependent malic enzyme [Actinobacteria bacterium]|nr:NAD-dependent malic enzyme [Actinomycetota bacterium]
MTVDFTYRARIEHRPGQLAKVMEAIAAAEGLIGEVRTCELTRSYSVRELTVEVGSPDAADELRERIAAIDGVEVEWCRDRALMLHEGGKLTVEPCRAVETAQDMRDVYTPGVARACEAIAEDPQTARKYTMIGRSVAICTNGTRVLGLGDIGPLAAMPVMEGKAVFYRQLAGISAIPILVDAAEPDAFVETVARIAPTFGGIHLEDISAPECFEIEARLIDELDQPVMHDDVHGTAVVALAAALTACHRTDTELGRATVGQLGLGAAGYGIASLMVEAGAQRVVGFDPDDANAERARERGVETVGEDEVLDDADILIATTGQPESIEPDRIRDGQVVLALTNPEPEIDPDRALEAGAAFAADGSMVNNVLGYPGIFRGALLAGARRIDPEMKLAAARALADLAEGDRMLPEVLDRAVHERVAEAVRDAAPERERAGASG